MTKHTPPIETMTVDEPDTSQATQTVSLVITPREKAGYRRLSGAAGMSVSVWAQSIFATIADTATTSDHWTEVLKSLETVNTQDGKTERTSVAIPITTADTLQTYAAALGVTRHRLARSILCHALGADPTSTASDREAANRTHAQSSANRPSTAKNGVAAPTLAADKRSPVAPTTAAPQAYLTELAKLYRLVHSACVIDRPSIPDIRDKLIARIQRIANNAGATEATIARRAAERANIAQSSQLAFIAGFVTLDPDDVAVVICDKAGMLAAIDETAHVDDDSEADFGEGDD